MGQYYLACNLDKKQLIDPHDFGDGAKLMEFACSPSGTAGALAVLLADGNGRGGGDCRSENPIIGSWAGDRIVVAGDYADIGKWGFNKNIYEDASGDGTDWTNISEQVLAALREDTPDYGG